MSRSKRKHSIGHIAYGNNTPYYKLARKHLRKVNKQNLKHLLSNFDINYINDNIISLDNKHDTAYDKWNEPTDGTFVIRDKNSEWYIKGLRK